MTINKNQLLQIVKEAGNVILEIYNDPKFSGVVDYKADDSPLTLADKASHKVIDKTLRKLYPSIPIISEESENNIDFNIRRKFNRFWLVDPLDGTKEFINRNGEFTVNIALIEKGVPVAGFIYVPVHNVFYYGIENKAYKIDNEERETLIQVNNSTSGRTAVRSKSHASPEEESILSKHNVTDSISVGSSLKFCMVAEGKADVYYRHGPTMEWDTAAGQAIVQAAGGKVFYGDSDSKIFTYNKESLLNGSFLCLGF